MSRLYDALSLGRRAPMKRTPMKRKRRSKAERDAKFHREYGWEGRVKWVQAQPCVFCGATPCENAHITNGGMGRKAGYDKIVPACEFCHWEMDHGIGKRAMERKYGVDLKAEAARVEREWEAEF